MIRNSVGFATAAIATLAIGIGASTAVVTVAETLLLRPLPVAAEDRIAILWGETPDGRFSNVPLRLGETQAFQRQARTIEQLAYHTFRGATTTAFQAGDRGLQLQLALVSGNYFDVLGSRPVVGRGFRDEDDQQGVAPVLVLSHRAWHRSFGGDSSIIGRSIVLATSGKSYSVVGVMPPGLDYPRGADVWAPLTAYGSSEGILDLVSNELDLVARLVPGATRAQARSELTTFFSGLTRSEWLREARGVAHGFRELVLGDAGPAMRIVLIAAAMLLLIACVNVANLLLVRSLDRVRELVVRSALGASRARLVRHQLRESAILSAAGGAAGIVLAAVAVAAFIRFAPASMPRLDEVSLNGVALVTALAISALTLFVSGLAPALFASRINAGDVLRSGARHTVSRRVRRVGELLVATQVALAVVALTSAALVTRSLVNLQRTDLAFDPAELMVVDLELRRDRVSSPALQRDLMTRLVSRLETLPGVRAVTPVLSVPFIGGGGGMDGRLATPTQTEAERARNPVVNMEIITPGYFRTLGTPVVRGREFNDDDRQGATAVVMVSASSASAFWPGLDPVGKKLGARGEWEVIGVVPDTRYRDLMAARPSVYFPLAQSFFPVTPTNLLIRAASPSALTAAGLRQAVAVDESDVTVASIATLAEVLEGPHAQPRLNALVLVLFAGAALTLAAIGLFSVMATMVRQRTRELGIRMALGATGGDVRRLVVMRGLVIASVGTLAGVVGARAAGSLLSGLLYEVRANDALTFVSVALLMLLVSALASLVPGQLGARVEPVSALRAET
jgi:predicted permease